LIRLPVNPTEEGDRFAKYDFTTGTAVRKRRTGWQEEGEVWEIAELGL